MGKDFASLRTGSIPRQRQNVLTLLTAIMEHASGECPRCRRPILIEAWYFCPICGLEFEEHEDAPGDC